jgi:phospholipid/cholesterol/gamma-HCH transport system substrate-binding protein
MNQTQFQKRVGVFVLFCLVLMGVLMLAFSKGTALFAASYEIRMRLRNVGGLKERSAVFLAGVQVGHLKSVELAQDGRSVVLRLRILKRFPIHRDAEFIVEQIGVLGDQFVSIYPRANAAPMLEDGEEVSGHESFNLQEVARSADDLLKQLSQTLGEVREGVTNVKRGVLDPVTLSNLSATVANARRASEHAIALTEGAANVVKANADPIGHSVSNLVRFSERLDEIATHLDETILTNRASLHGAVSNFEQASASLATVARGLEAGQGVAGSLLKSDELQAHLTSTFSNLSVLSSNLNRYGLLYKPKQPRAKPFTPFPGKRP